MSTRQRIIAQADDLRDPRGRALLEQMASVNKASHKFMLPLQ